jgi:3-deoxy-D-manno-octulosonic acid kinase
VIDPASIPRGFAIVSDDGARTLIADGRHAERILALGLQRPEAWPAPGGDAPAGAGRGATAVLPLGPRGSLRLKQLRRGGCLGSLWGQRFAGPGRLLRNLTLPVEAALRGIDTPSPVALLVAVAGPGLYRGWLAVENVPDATDLLAALRSAAPPSSAELACAMRAVRRMHDRGLEHRDLNLGNVLLRRGGPPGALVIDLDAARLRAGPLGFRARQRALRRLERSHVKAGLDPSRADDYYALYAGDDADLSARLQRGRRAGRAWIHLHGLAWPGTREDRRSR